MELTRDSLVFQSCTKDQLSRFPTWTCLREVHFFLTAIASPQNAGVGTISAIVNLRETNGYANPLPRAGA